MGHCTFQYQQLERSGDLEAAAGLAEFLQFIMYINVCICISIDILSADFNLIQERGDSYQPIHACLSAVVFSLLIHVVSHVYVYCVCVYSCMPAYQEFVLTLATGWT